MMDLHTDSESVEFELKPRAPRMRGRAIGRVGTGLGVLALIALLVALIVSRTAGPQGDPLAKVMPSNLAIYFSMATHPDEQPNFNVVADAWEDSKEAKQIESSLKSALEYSGFDWEKDVQPWLGDRVAVGIVDLGGYEKPAEDNSRSFPRYRTPFIIIAAHTRDRARSDAFLADFREQRESALLQDSVVMDQMYRDIPIAYVVYNATDESTFGEAFATIDDTLVMIPSGPDDLKKVIDAALDKTNLGSTDNFNNVMHALPDPNVATFYIDYGRYMDLLTAMQQDLYAGSGDSGYFKDLPERQRTQMELIEQMAQGFGGAGLVMAYEPGGIRFDMAMQIFPDRLPESLRAVYNPDLPAPSNRIFDSIPSSAVVAVNMGLSVWTSALDSPDYWQMVFSGYPGVGDVAAEIEQFEKEAGIDLSADLLGLLNGEAALVVLPKSPDSNQAGRSSYSYFPSLPFQVAAMLDSSDAARASASLDKMLNALIEKPGVRFSAQPLSGLPYTALLDENGDVMLVYGVVDGRLVIGSNSDTLLAIDNADQAPLSADAAFKEAMAALPANRLSGGYMQIGPFVDVLQSIYGPSASECGVCNYLKPIKWLSLSSEPPDKATGIQRSTIHIRIEPAK